MVSSHAQRQAAPAPLSCRAVALLVCAKNLINRMCMCSHHRRAGAGADGARDDTTDASGATGVGAGATALQPAASSPAGCVARCASERIRQRQTRRSRTRRRAIAGDRGCPPSRGAGDVSSGRQARGGCARAAWQAVWQPRREHSRHTAKSRRTPAARAPQSRLCERRPEGIAAGSGGD